MVNALVQPGRKDAASELAAYLAEHEARSTLRFITCGSVDDGKSTLIGRLLYESNLVLDDHLATLEVDSRKVGTRGAELDFALLVDGLQAEREQGITIDVAYRFFTTATRQFIVADTPGHVQYTRNMATGASTADLAVILVDATKGVLPQTRRHTHLVSLMGIDQVIVAINKLDLVDYDEATFVAIAADYQQLADAVNIASVTAVPLSAANGDNLTAPSARTPWYTGPTLLGALEAAPVAQRDDEQAFRLPVQWVNRPDRTFRGFAGQIQSGSVRVGDPVVVLPAGVHSRIERVVTPSGDDNEAVAGQSVTVTLADEIDVSRGDVLCAPDRLPATAERFRAHLVWMSETPLVAGRRYHVKIGSNVVGAVIERPMRVVDVETLDEHEVEALELNDIGHVEVALDRPVVFDSYVAGRGLGGFILIDRVTNDTVAAGMIDESLASTNNLHWQHLEVDAIARTALMGHGAAVVWLTGLSGAGKSTIANILERKLHARDVHTFLLDGDNLRHGLCRDLGFTTADRAENIRRAGEVAALMHQAGLVVVAAFISPYESERQGVRELFEPGQFCEVYVDTPLSVASERDPKGLYAKVQRGELTNFTGVDAPYEIPQNADVRIDTTALSAEHAAERILEHLVLEGIVADV